MCKKQALLMLILLLCGAGIAHAQIKIGNRTINAGKALNKLVELSQGAKASAVQKMFSSHPDSEKRAAKMKEKADRYNAEQQ